MTIGAILTCLSVAGKGASLSSMVDQSAARGIPLSYSALTGFFHRSWSVAQEVKAAATSIFDLSGGWVMLDEIVIAKSQDSLRMPSVRRRHKSAGGYVTPAIAVVLLLWSDGTQRVPLAFEYRSGPDSVQEVAWRLLRRLRHQFRLKPQCVLFDAGFFSLELVRRITSYGWAFVCRVPKKVALNGKQLWRFKQQGFWNDPGKLSNGVKVRAVRRKNKFYLCNRVSWSAKTILAWYRRRAVIEEVFRLLKQCCHWSYCQLRSEAAYERYLATGIFCFMAWETARLQQSEPTTIYELRRTVMFRQGSPPIPEYFRHWRAS